MEIYILDGVKKRSGRNGKAMSRYLYSAVKQRNHMLMKNPMVFNQKAEILMMSTIRLFTGSLVDTNSTAVKTAVKIP